MIEVIVQNRADFKAIDQAIISPLLQTDKTIKNIALSKLAMQLAKTDNKKPQRI